MKYRSLALIFKSFCNVLSPRTMTGKQLSKTFVLMAISMLIFDCQGQPTIDTSNKCLCENDSRFRDEYGAISWLEKNSLQELVSKLVVELSEQREQLNALKLSNCSRNERLVDNNTEKIAELKRIFVEARYHTARDNLAIRSQLNEVTELTESIQQWNITLVDRLAKLELENLEGKEFIRHENGSLRTINNKLQQHISQMNSMQEQLHLVNNSVQKQTDEISVLFIKQTEQLRLVQQNGAVQEEQLVSLRQLNISVMETIALEQETRTSLNELNETVVERIAALEIENKNCEERLKQTNGSLSRELAQLKEHTNQQTQQLLNATRHPNDTAVAYIRWGRKVCPQNSTVLYKGYAAGNLFSEQGGGSNYLCLPERPEWGRTLDGVQAGGSFIHGVEYEMQASHSPFLTTNNGGSELLNANAPCSLCQVTGRSTQIMIPARNDCPATWYLQYRGYLVTSHRSHQKKDYICLDEAPETVHGSHRNDNGGLLYLVEATCGSLPCPHYVNGWEIACVVCVR